MWSIFEKIVDSAFPPSADELLVRDCAEDTLLELYQPTARDGVTILLPYQHPTVRALIHLAKFQYHQESYRLLACILQHHLAHAAPVRHWLIPIPLSAARWRERGYNQVEEVARRAIEQQDVSILMTSVFHRTRHTAPQTSLNRAQRLTNVQHAFSIRTQTTTPPAVIILDDVCTTGSTLKAAQLAGKASYPDTPIVRLALAG